ncbi:MAG: hypothetical protein QM762_14745 [Chryseolinea sp.]
MESKPNDPATIAKAILAEVTRIYSCAMSSLILSNLTLSNITDHNITSADGSSLQPGLSTQTLHNP